MDFLMTLRGRGMEVWADGDQLRCRGPVGTLTPELRAELGRRKEEILGFLRSAASLARQQPAIVPLQSEGNNVPIYAVAGHNGDVFCYRALAQRLGNEQPFFGLQPPGLDGNREPLTKVEELAAYFASQIREVQESGPYVIAGYCAGGTIAFELARQLQQSGAKVKTLGMFGSPFPTLYKLLPRLSSGVEELFERAIRHAGAVTSLSLRDLRAYIAERWGNLRASWAAKRNAKPDPVLAWREKVGDATLAAIKVYEPKPFEGHMTLFWPNAEWRLARNSLEQWSALAKSVEKHFGPKECDGQTMLQEPHAPRFAELIALALGIEPGRTIARRPSMEDVRSQSGQIEAYLY